MKPAYLGDSFDLVKRHWGETLRDIAPLYAEPRFIPPSMRSAYTQVTGIQVLTAPLSRRHLILNDPDTGIRLPGQQNQREGRTHIAIPTIAQQLTAVFTQCAVTFDQAFHRDRSLNACDQRRLKMEALDQQGYASLYYVSHAPFPLCPDLS